MPDNVIGLGESGKRVDEKELARLIINHLSKGDKNVIKNIRSFHKEEVEKVSRGIISIFGGSVISARTLNACFYEMVRSLGYTTSLLCAPYRTEPGEPRLVF